MNFKQTLGTAIYGKMSNSSDLTGALGGTAIYHKIAPDDVAKPYIVWNFQSAIDENATPSRMWNTIVNIRNFANTDAQSGTIDSWVDSLFNGVALSVSGWTNFYTARENYFDDVIVEDSKDKTYVTGGLYRVRMGQ